MKKIGIIIVIAIVTLLLLGLIALYIGSTRFWPHCPNSPYVFVEPLNRNITNNEEAKASILNWSTGRNPDIDFSRFNLDIIEADRPLRVGKNISEGRVWVIEDLDIAIDKQGNLYYNIGCF